MYGSLRSKQLCSQSLLDSTHVCSQCCVDQAELQAVAESPKLGQPTSIDSVTTSAAFSSPRMSGIEEKLLPFSASTSTRTSSRMELEGSAKSWATGSQLSTSLNIQETAVPYQDSLSDSDPGYSIITTDHTAEAILLCDKWVLKPCRVGLKAIGWLPCSQSLAGRVCHGVTVSVWTLAIVTAMVTQILSCFRRDVFISVEESTIGPASSNGSQLTAELATPPPFQCSKNIISSLILPDIILLIAYFFGVYIFTKGETEYLFRLASQVFIKNVEAESKHYSKQIIVTIVLIFVGGLLWITFSLIIRIMAAISGKLFDDRFIVFWPPNTYIEDEVKIFLVMFSLFGFFTFDLVYLFSVLNYAAQAEMNVYLLWDINRLIRNKKYEHVDGAIKATQETKRYLKVLNRNTAILTALALFDLFNLALSGLIDLGKVNDGVNLRSGDPSLRQLAAVAAGFNCASWLILVAVPFIQAARVTHACELLKDVGPEVRARPYQYQNTDQLELDSLVSFLYTVDLKASFFGIPIHPWMGYSVIVSFVFSLLILFQLGTFNSLSPYI